MPGQAIVVLPPVNVKDFVAKKMGRDVDLTFHAFGELEANLRKQTLRAVDGTATSGSPDSRGSAPTAALLRG